MSTTLRCHSICSSLLCIPVGSSNGSQTFFTVESSREVLKIRMPRPYLRYSKSEYLEAGPRYQHFSTLQWLSRTAKIKTLIKTFVTQSVFQGSAALESSTGSLLEMQNLSPNPDLLNQNLHFNQSPGSMCVKVWEMMIYVLMDPNVYHQPWAPAFIPNWHVGIYPAVSNLTCSKLTSLLKLVPPNPSQWHHHS